MPVPTPIRVAAADLPDLPDARTDDPARGRVRDRAPVPAPATDTRALVCGIALMAAGESFAPHYRPQAAVGCGLEGDGAVPVGGPPDRPAPGVALYIAGGAVHGVPLATGPLKWFDTFAADRFADIDHRFLHET